MANKLVHGLTSLLLPLGLYGAAQFNNSPHSYGSYNRSSMRGAATTLYSPATSVIPFELKPLSQTISGTSDDDIQLSRASRELIIIDEAVPDKHILLSGLDPAIEVVQIDSSKDGLDQLASILANQHDLSALHIVSHATDGQFQLGSSWVSAELLEQKLHVLGAMDEAMRDGADVLLYGCDIARTESGDALLQLIAAGASVDVAASNNATGVANRGGDWDLEIKKGNIDTSRPFSDIALKDFSALLALPADNTTFTFAAGWTDNGDDLSHAYFDLGASDFFMPVVAVNITGGAAHMYKFGAPIDDPGSFYMAADGVNVETFQLTEVVLDETAAYAFDNVYITGYVSGGGTVTSTTEVGTAGQDTLTITGAELATFSGVDLTAFAINFQPDGFATASDLKLTSFTTTSAAAPAGGNTSPVADLNGGVGGIDVAGAFTEGGGAVAIAPAATASDADIDTITTITVSLTNDQDGVNEGLNVTAAAQNALTGIAGATDIALQDTITIAGATASAAEVSTFLQAITYNNTAAGPDTTARTITVVINDGTDPSTTATTTMSVSVAAANAAPTTVADPAVTNEDNAVLVDVLFNDSDGDGALVPASVTVSSAPANGGTSVNAGTGVITYTPNADFEGADSFSYTVDDDDGATSAAALVSVTVNAQNDAPVAVADDVDTNVDTLIAIDVAANDTDIDALDSPDSTTIVVVGAASNGSAVFNGGTNRIDYTPNGGYTGADSFTYTIDDGVGATSNVATVSVTVGAAAISLTPEQIKVLLDIIAAGRTAEVLYMNPSTASQLGGESLLAAIQLNGTWSNATTVTLVDKDGFHFVTDYAARAQNFFEVAFRIDSAADVEPGSRTITFEVSDGGYSTRVTTAIEITAEDEECVVGKESIDGECVISKPSITNVSIPNVPHGIGDTVTATITVEENPDDFTEDDGDGSIEGTIAGYTLGNFKKESDSSYTAEFTVVALAGDDGSGTSDPVNHGTFDPDTQQWECDSGYTGTTCTEKVPTNDGSDGDIAAANDIPVSIILSNSLGKASEAYTTSISQNNDAITRIDNPGFVLEVGENNPPLDPFAVAEGGQFYEFKVALQSRPISNVIIELNTDIANQLVFEPSSLTFSPSNWNSFQPLVVSALDDSVAESEISVSVSIAITSSDTKYAALSAPSASILVQDNDIAAAITNVSIPNQAHVIGDTVTATISVKGVEGNFDTYDKNDPLCAPEQGGDPGADACAHRIEFGLLGTIAGIDVKETVTGIDYNADINTYTVDFEIPQGSENSSSEDDSAEASISGTIIQGASNAEGILVYIYDTDGEFIAAAATGSDGSYTITGLQSVDYRVDVYDSDALDAQTPILSATVTAAAKGTTLDFDLDNLSSTIGNILTLNYTAIPEASGGLVATWYVFVTGGSLDPNINYGVKFDSTIVDYENELGLLQDNFDSGTSANAVGNVDIDLNALGLDTACGELTFRLEINGWDPEDTDRSALAQAVTKTVTVPCADASSGTSSSSAGSAIPDIAASSDIPVNLTLSNVEGVVVGETYTTSISQDSDAIFTTPAKVTISAPSTAEEGSSVPLTVSVESGLGAFWPKDITLDLSYDGSVATAGVDFTKLDSVTIKANTGGSGPVVGSTIELQKTLTDEEKGWSWRYYFITATDPATDKIYIYGSSNELIFDRDFSLDYATITAAGTFDSDQPTLVRTITPVSEDESIIGKELNFRIGTFDPQAIAVRYDANQTPVKGIVGAVATASSVSIALLTDQLFEETGGTGELLKVAIDTTTLPTGVIAGDPAAAEIAILDKITLPSVDAFEAYTKQDVRDLDDGFVSVLDGAHFGALSTVAINAVSADQLGLIPAEAFAGLDSDRLANLEPNTLKALSAEQLGELSAAAIAGLDAEQISAIPASVLAELSSAQIAKLTREAISGISTAQFSLLNNEQLFSLSGAQLGALSAEVLRTVTTEDVESILNRSAIKTMSNRDFSRFVTNLERNVGAWNLSGIMPPGWSFSDILSGSLSAPANAELAFRELILSKQDKVNLPVMVDLNSSLALGGVGRTDLLVQMNRALASSDFADYAFRQLSNGIVVLETGSGTKTSYSALLLDMDNLVQGAAGTASVGFRAGSQPMITTADGIKIPLHTTLEQPAAIATLIAGAQVDVSATGEVAITLPENTSIDGLAGVRKVLGKPDIFIDVSDSGQKTGIAVTKNEDGANELVVFNEDGTQHSLLTAIQSVEQFREIAGEIPLSGVSNRFDGTVSAVSSGNGVLVEADLFNIGLPDEETSPRIQAPAILSRTDDDEGNLSGFNFRNAQGESQRLLIDELLPTTDAGCPSGYVVDTLDGECILNPDDSAEEQQTALDNAVTELGSKDLTDPSNVTDDVVNTVTNVLDSTKDLADKVADQLADGTIATSTALDTVNTISETLNLAGAVTQGGGDVDNSAITNSLTGITDIFTALGTDLDSSQISQVQTSTISTVKAVESVFSSLTSVTDTVSLISNVSDVIDSALKTGATLNTDLLSSAQSLTQTALQNTLSDVASALDNSLSVTFTDVASTQTLLKSNTELLAAVVDTVSVKLKSAVSLDITSTAATLEASGLSSTDASALSTNLAQFVNPTGISSETSSGKIVSAADSIGNAFGSGSTATVNPTTNVIELAVGTDRIPVAATKVAIVPKSIPNGVSTLPDGSRLAVSDGIATTLVPAPKDPVGFSSALSSLDANLKISSTGSLQIKTDTLTFSGTFSFDGLGKSASTASDGVEFTAPTGDPADPSYSYKVNYPDGTSQNLLPTVNDDNFETSLSNRGFSLSTSRSTGVITVENTVKFKPDYFVTPLKAADQAYWDANKDSSGVAYRQTDVNNDGKDDYEVISANGVQVVYGIK